MDLGSKDLLWRDPDGGDWLVQVHLAAIDGRAECVGIEFRSFGETQLERWIHDELPEKGESTGVVSASLIRTLPVGRLISEAKQTAIRHAELTANPQPLSEETRELERRSGVEGALDAFLASRAIRARAAVLPALRAGRPPIYDPAEIAEVYLRGGAAPTLAVAEHFHISRSAAAKRVARARESGFLDKTTQGKTSGRRLASSPTKE